MEACIQISPSLRIAPKVLPRLGVNHGQISVADGHRLDIFWAVRRVDISAAVNRARRSTTTGDIPSVVLVLVQPKMEKRRSPLVSIPPFRAGIFKA